MFTVAPLIVMTRDSGAARAPPRDFSRWSDPCAARISALGSSGGGIPSSLRPYRPPIQSACSAPALMAAPIRSRFTSMPAAADNSDTIGVPVDSRVCGNYVGKWWAGTALNRRHQIFRAGAVALDVVAEMAEEVLNFTSESRCGGTLAYASRPQAAPRFRGERHVEISTSPLGVGRADAPRLRPRRAGVPTLWGAATVDRDGRGPRGYPRDPPCARRVARAEGRAPQGAAGGPHPTGVLGA